MALAGCGHPSLDVAIPKESILPKISSQFPVTKTRGAFTLTLSQPRVRFDGAGNRIGLDASLDFAMQGQPPGHGNVSLDAALDCGEGTLALTDVAVRSLNLDLLSGDDAAVMQRVLSQSLTVALEGLIIYRIKQDDSLESRASQNLASVRVTDDGLTLHFQSQ